MLSTYAKRKLSLTATIIVCLTGPIWATFELFRYIYIGGLDFLLEPPGIYFLGGWFFLMGVVATFCYVPLQYKSRTTSDDLESAGQEHEMRKANFRCC
jgi:hypothetical protein